MTSNRWPRFLGALLAAAVLASATAVSARETAAIPEVAAVELPREARETLELIKQGGPFPHERDGVVFGNRERRLPARSRGYYREYTVPTPGAVDRGARRIVAGRCAEQEGAPGTAGGTHGGTARSRAARHFLTPCASAEYYYTDDHYRSFRRIRE